MQLAPSSHWLWKNPWFLTLLVSAFFSAGSPASVIALQEIPVAGVVFARCFGACLLLFIVFRKRLLSFWKSLARPLTVAQGQISGRTLAFLSGIALGLHFYLYVAGLKLTSFAAAVTLIALEPIAVLLASALFFKIHPTRAQWFGLIIAVIGTLTIALAPQLWESIFAIQKLNAVPSEGTHAAFQAPHSLLGDLAMLAAVTFYGFYYAANRALRERIPVQQVAQSELTLACLIYFSASLTALIIWSFTTEGWGMFSSGEGARQTFHLGSNPQTWMALATLILLPTLLGHTLCQFASRRISPIWIALMSPGETLVTLSLGFFIFGNQPTVFDLIGGLAVLAGGLVIVLKEK